MLGYSGDVVIDDLAGREPNFVIRAFDRIMRMQIIAQALMHKADGEVALVSSGAAIMFCTLFDFRPSILRCPRKCYGKHAAASYPRTLRTAGCKMRSVVFLLTIVTLSTAMNEGLSTERNLLFRHSLDRDRYRLSYCPAQFVDHVDGLLYPATSCSI